MQKLKILIQTTRWSNKVIIVQNSHVNRDSIHNTGVVLKMQGLEIAIQATRYAK